MWWWTSVPGIECRSYSPQSNLYWLSWIINVLFMSMGWDNISELRPQTGLFFIHQVIWGWRTMVEHRQWNTPGSFNRALWKSYQQSHLVVKQKELANEIMDFCLMKNLFHASKGPLTYGKSFRRGTDGFTPLWRKACCGFLSRLKIHRPWQGLKPQNLGPMASTITTRPPKTTLLISFVCYP
jgi:hypothetical protein